MALAALPNVLTAVVTMPPLPKLVSGVARAPRATPGESRRHERSHRATIRSTPPVPLCGAAPPARTVRACAANLVSAHGGWRAGGEPLFLGDDRARLLVVIDAPASRPGRSGPRGRTAGTWTEWGT